MELSAIVFWAVAQRPVDEVALSELFWQVNEAKHTFENFFPKQCRPSSWATFLLQLDSSSFLDVLGNHPCCLGLEDATRGLPHPPQGGKGISVSHGRGIAAGINGGKVNLLGWQPLHHGGGLLLSGCLLPIVGRVFGNELLWQPDWTGWLH